MDGEVYGEKWFQGLWTIRGKSFGDEGWNG